MGSLSPVYRPKGDLGSKRQLPTTVGELTAAWFSHALDREVTGVAITKEIHGTASKISVELTYVDAQGAPPARLCVKGGFNPDLMKAFPAVLICYRLEAEFYYHIAPTAAMNLPRVYYCGTDTVNGQGLVVMEDLAVSNTTFGSVLEPWTPERVREGVQELALLHARTWGARLEDFPWYESNGLREAMENLWAPEAWHQRFFTDACPPVPDDLKDRARIVAAFHTLWRTEDPRFRAIVHGDSHVANTFMSASGRPGFLDWQAFHPNSALHDVPYFITGALTIEDRRQHESDLLQAYLDALARAGGPRFAVEDVWDEYRRQHLHGFALSLATPMMQPKEIVDAFAERHATAVKDHQSLELIEFHLDHRPEN